MLPMTISLRYLDLLVGLDNGDVAHSIFLDKDQVGENLKQSKHSVFVWKQKISMNVDQK